MQNVNNIDSEKFSTAWLVVSKILEKYGINSANFARIAGKNPTYVNDIKKGKTRRISNEVADKIIEHWPELSRTWILTGEGEMLLSVPPAADPLQRSIQGASDAEAEFYKRIVEDKERRIEQLVRENERMKMELEAVKSAASAYSAREGAFSGTTVPTEA